MRDFRNLLFDFDGTLVDSSPLHALAIQETLYIERQDLLTGFCYEPLKGLTTEDAFRRLGITDAQQLRRCVSYKQQLYRDFVRNGQLTLLPGAREALTAARAEGCRIFLVTSGSPASIAAALTAHALTEAFDGLVTSNDVARAKPAPDPYTYCLRHFGLMAGQSVAIEDAPSGIQSARDADLFVIGIHNRHIKELVDLFFGDLLAFASAFSHSDLRDAVI